MHLLKTRFVYYDLILDEKDRSYSVNEYIEMLGFGWFQVKLTFVIGLSWVSKLLYFIHRSQVMKTVLVSLRVI